MYGLNKCSYCDSPPGPLDERVLVNTYEVKLPFARTVDLWSTFCNHCGRANYSYTHDGATCLWLASEESLVEHLDYDVVKDSGQRLFDRQVSVAWWWSPLSRNVSFNLGIIDGLIRVVNRAMDDYRVLVIAASVPTRTSSEIFQQYHKVIRLKRHITDDAAGPFSSIRAGRSLIRTFGRGALRNIFHFWPSDALSATGYMPIAIDYELRKRWAQHNRREIPIRANRRPNE